MKYDFMLRKIIIAILIIALPSVLFGQPDNQVIEKMIVEEMEGVLKGSMKSNDYRFDSTNARHFLVFVKKYENSPSSIVRFRTQRIKFLIASQTRDTLIRQQVTEDLVNSLSDSTQIVAQYAKSRLIDFGERDFSVKTKKIMIAAFNKFSSYNDFILVCGIAQLKELIPDLKKMAADFDRAQTAWYNTPAWYASLALARMGVNQKMDAIIAAVELELTGLRVVKLLDFVAYTRQPDAIRLLQKYLESTEKLPGLKDPEKGTPFNQYALEFLARHMEGFPVKPRGVFRYTPEEVETARQFLRSRESTH
jgi:hypothetical protein